MIGLTRAFPTGFWWWIVGISLPVLVLLVIFAVDCLGGPARHRWFLVDVWNRWLPWRRRRLHRDFTGALVRLLDAGVPEARAVALAAEGTASPGFEKQAAGVVRSMSGGLTLAEALSRLDDSGELRWRIDNALRGRPNRFADSLRGWLEWLDVTAARQEQTAAQVLGAVMVLASGLVVALAAATVLRGLCALIEQAGPDLPW